MAAFFELYSNVTAEVYPHDCSSFKEENKIAFSITMIKNTNLESDINCNIKSNCKVKKKNKDILDNLYLSYNFCVLFEFTKVLTSDIIVWILIQKEI